MAWFPTRLSLDSWLENDRWSGVLRTAHREVRLEDVRSVWCRAPSAFQFPVGMSEPERLHAGWEAKFGVGGGLSTLPVLWVNHPGREADACYKPAQVVMAPGWGFRVPDTIVTNEPAGIRQFAARHPGGVVVKTLGAVAVLESGGVTVAHTHRLTAEDLGDLSGVDVTAHLFQTWVDKAYEVRVTAVGERLFAVAIDAGSDSAREDWRNDFEALTYRVVDVPGPVASAVAAYLGGFGLSFAAFDFAVTAEGEWVFFEANPGGQYGWLQAATGLPIGAAVADLLEKGCG